jgi:type VI secretion system protein ImpC
MIRGADNGSVDGLVVSSYKTSQGERLIGPTEFLLPLRLDSELAESGFVPLCAYKNDCRAVFFSVGSLQRSEPSPGSRRADDTGFPVTLPQLLACCRFAHYLMCIFRERPRYFTARADLRMFLTNWINQYISVGDGLSQETLISKPLADARLEVVEQPDQPGCYKLDLQIRPRYQLVGTPALRLDVALPPRNALADLL